MYENIYESIRNAAQKRNLRESTINLYCNDVRYFLKCTGKDVTDLTIEDVDAFLTAKRLEGRSPETYNHYHSAIRFFYKKILKLNWDDEDIPRMKLNRSLPTVLSREEISAIIDVTKNLKHKAMIATMYSSGLRVSEVIHLHYDDISRTNMTIHVRNTKAAGIVIRSFHRRTLIFLQNTGSSAVAPGKYCSRAHGPAVTLMFQA